MHDWYPTSASYYNIVQKLNLDKSRLPVPFMQLGECLHGVGSFKQSMFPQSIGMSASWDTSLVHRVGRAIGTEARALGIHACLAPVLDLGKDVRWGRVQGTVVLQSCLTSAYFVIITEAWGEDFLLTSHMGVAYASGLSKNGSWSDTDAVVPVMKVVDSINYFLRRTHLAMSSILPDTGALSEELTLLRITVLD